VKFKYNRVYIKFIDPGKKEIYPPNSNIWIKWIKEIVKLLKLSRNKTGKIILKGNIHSLITN
jgi:hypothetical protein